MSFKFIIRTFTIRASLHHLMLPVLMSLFKAFSSPYRFSLLHFRSWYLKSAIPTSLSQTVTPSRAWYIYTPWTVMDTHTTMGLNSYQPDSSKGMLNREQMSGTHKFKTVVWHWRTIEQSKDMHVFGSHPNSKSYPSLCGMWFEIHWRA